jgi:hypothetical protein
MNFTIGYIDHNQEIYNKYLKPSLDSLNEDFELISISDKLYPAENYNKIIHLSHNNWIILTHQDVSFPSNLLECIEKTIKEIGEQNVGALAMVGVNVFGEYNFSKKNIIYEIQTSDCCFIVINKENNIYFDNLNFDEYHLYVEDYCLRINKELNKKIYTILIDSEGIMDKDWNNSFIFNKLRHHSYTCDKIGFCWGRYGEYRNKLTSIWGDVKTT